MLPSLTGASVESIRTLRRVGWVENCGGAVCDGYAGRPPAPPGAAHPAASAGDGRGDGRISEPRALRAREGRRAASWNRTTRPRRRNGAELARLMAALGREDRRESPAPHQVDPRSQPFLKGAELCQRYPDGCRAKLRGAGVASRPQLPA